MTEPGVAFRVGFTGRVISNTLPGKRKRSGPSASSSTSSLAEDAIVYTFLLVDEWDAIAPPDLTLVKMCDMNFEIKGRKAGNETHAIPMVHSAIVNIREDTRLSAFVH